MDRRVCGDECGDSDALQLGRNECLEKNIWKKK
jgi:hypothetical protein